MATQSYIKLSVFPNLWCRKNLDSRVKTYLEMLIFFALSLQQQLRRLAKVWQNFGK
jgi:hypothetical protein